MSRTSQRNYSSRRNLTAVAPIEDASDNSHFHLQQHSPISSGPTPTFDDSEEDDAELKALRQAALSSRKPENRPPSSIANGKITSTSSRNNLDSGLSSVVSQIPSTETTGRIDSRVTVNGQRHHGSSVNSLRPPQMNSGRSKYEDLDLEDLRQVVRASKRSRFDRRNNSDGSSSEDDDYDYMKSRRHDNLESNSSPRPTFDRKGYRSGASSLSPPPAQTTQSPESTPPGRNWSPNRRGPASPDRSTSDRDTAAAMERRRQKFGPGSVMDDKTRVSLTSLKSSSAESMHKSTSD